MPGYAAGMMSTTALRPSQLNALARDLLEGAFPSVLVEGEISGLARPASGHLYFALKDERAQVRCALFKPKSQWLRFVPRDGMQVLARGRLTLYEPRGDYQLVLDTLEEAGEGALRRAFEALKAKLAAEGLFDAARKRPLPRWPRRIGVLTSPSGAVIRDIVSVFARRFPLAQLELLPVPVQGEGSAAKIAAMLEAAAASQRYDVLLLARGGGSLDDLWAFNDETLARRIAACTVPVVSAVGHETDVTLADFAADLRAPTPSAAAELLSPDRAELQHTLAQQQRRLNQRMRWQLQQAAQRTDRAALRLSARDPHRQLALLAQRHAQARLRLLAGFRQRLDAWAMRLARTHAGLRLAEPSERLLRDRERLHALHTRLRRAEVQRLQQHTLHLRGLARTLASISPLATVARGYSLLRTVNGVVVRRVADVAPGDTLRARVGDGELELGVLAAHRHAAELPD